MNVTAHGLVTAALVAGVASCGFMMYRRWFKVCAETDEDIPDDTQTALWIAATAILGIALAFWWR